MTARRFPAGLLLMAGLLLGLPLTAAAAADAAPAAEKDVWTSKSGAYRLSYDSRLASPGINHIHAWVLHLETRSGEPVTGAEFQVTGGMPAHNHGLPTQPRVTRELGHGNYLLEGVRFHMNGAWQITFSFEVAGEHDEVVVSMRL